ncbi:hypothetical protein [Rhizobium halophilum]|uniref:hypothetical protein n=1 Tax=Rhizobium halophilum TaxID=2846852 RepID=UPI001EFDB954|nr:hypothetical protein [Rhizobium halophilum]MCF6371045.1 hypothetical protein [Rhizobium halophilum]
MARLLPFIDVPLTSQRPLSGPESVNPSQGTTIGNFTQTVASPFGGWAFEFNFHPMQGDQYVRFRGWLWALQRGANATRWQMTERDKMSPARAGVSSALGGAVAWSNGQMWSNNRPWKLTYPNVKVAAAAAVDTTIINLADEYWGRRLRWGERIGFFPFHFGMYQVTEDFGDGRYRVWPPLRKAITTDDYATLYPVLVLQMMVSQEMEYPSEDAALTIGASVRMFEAFDYDVRDYFTD